MSHWLSDDPELLAATLELLDTWGDDNAALGIGKREISSKSYLDAALEVVDVPAHQRDLGTEDVGNTGTPRLNARENGAKSSTNQRRRHEIHGLRIQTEKLQTRLKVLRLTEHAYPDALAGQLPMVSLWRRVAENQLRLRRESELEQVKLRRLLEAHTSIAQGMAMLVGKSQEMRARFGYAEAEEAVCSLQRDMPVDGTRLESHGSDQQNTVESLVLQSPRSGPA